MSNAHYCIFSHKSFYQFVLVQVGSHKSVSAHVLMRALSPYGSWFFINRYRQIWKCYVRLVNSKVLTSPQ